MSEFHVQVVRVGPIMKHPNADTLSITHVWDYPLVVRTGDFQEGGLAVYVPVDSLVPVADPRWAFLDGHNRIKAKRLRGIFSMGLLTPAEPTWIEGQDVADILGITKYEPPDPATMGGENEKDPGFLPVYTDIEGLRRWGEVLVPGEEVVITEKVHGACSRFLHRDGRLWVGSHTCIKKQDAANMWWRVAERYALANCLQATPNIAIYGEVYGQVQDLKYGAGRDEYLLTVFDALDTMTRTYLDYDSMVELVQRLGLPLVPLLYRGPWSPDLTALANGKTTMPGADHVREGIVIKPVHERFDERVGRVILKLHGEDYLLRKETKHAT